MEGEGKQEVEEAVEKEVEEEEVVVETVQSLP